MPFDVLPGRLGNIPQQQWISPPPIIKPAIGPAIATGLAGVADIINENFTPEARLIKAAKQKKLRNYLLGIDDTITTPADKLRLAAAGVNLERQKYLLEKAKQGKPSPRRISDVYGRYQVIQKPDLQSATVAPTELQPEQIGNGPLSQSRLIPLY